MRQPRLGFLGVGWIGRDRMRAIAASGAAEMTFVADASVDAAASAAEEVGAHVVDPEELLHSSDIDGIVIATPSAMHADQAVIALERGVSVFCQKPLGRTAAETKRVVDAARASNTRLAVDLSYRHLEATREIKSNLDAGTIGRVFAAELVFHNAYGPDKAWFKDRELAGGGCVIDLAVHLVDLLGWMFPSEVWRVANARLHADGALLDVDAAAVEDYAIATLVSDAGVSVSLACSWFLNAGVDAAIGATLYGTNGALSFHNVGGSFYDFEAALHRGTTRQVLVSPPDQWGGRAAVAWAEALGRSVRKDGPARAGELGELGELDQLVATATLIDGIYGR